MGNCVLLGPCEEFFLPERSVLIAMASDFHSYGLSPVLWLPLLTEGKLYTVWRIDALEYC